MLLFLPYFGDEIKENKLGRTRSTHVRNEKHMQYFNRKT
jgi:hypothetical protein